MAAIANEPFRGLAKVKIDDGLGGRRAYTVSIDDVVPDTAAADQATWEGAPGSNVTLRFEWDTTGSPAYSQADTVTVAVRLPGGGSNVGSTWSPTITGNSGVATTTMHFDDDPLNGSSGSSRAGMLEILLTVRRTAAVAWGPLDSRGTSTSPPAATTISWARGYLRSRVTVSAFSVSDASLGGAEPAGFYATKSTFMRFTLADPWHRGLALLAKHRQASADVRSSDADTPTDTAAQRDYTWNAAATGSTNKGRINKDYAAASTATDIRLVLPSNSFGGSNDLEYYFDTTGGLITTAGWTRVDASTLEKASRITVDPRVKFTQLLQANDNTWHTTPITGDAVPAGQRLASDLDFIASRATDNAASPAGLNGIAWTEKLWDTGQLIGSEASPVKSRASTGTTQGTQAGWSDAFLTWDNSLPPGSWTQKEVLTTTDLVGLELTNTRTLQLLSKDPRVRLIALAGDPDNPGRHWSPGQKLVVGFAVTKRISASTAQVLAPDAGSGRFALARFKPSTGRKEYLDPTDTSAGAAGTWKESVGTAAFNLFTAAASAGDSALQIYTFNAADTTVAKGWNYEDIVVECWLDVSGVTEVGVFGLDVVNTRFPHDGDDSTTESHITAAVATETTNRVADVDAEEAARIAAVSAEASARAAGDAAATSAAQKRVLVDALPFNAGGTVATALIRVVDDDGDPLAPDTTPTVAVWLSGQDLDSTPYATPAAVAVPGQTGDYTITVALPGAPSSGTGDSLIVRARATVGGIVLHGWATVGYGNPLTLTQYQLLTQGGLADSLHHHSSPMDPEATRFTARAGADASATGWETVTVDRSIQDPTLASVIAARRVAAGVGPSIVILDKRPPETFLEGTSYPYDDGKTGPKTYTIMRKEAVDRPGGKATRLTLNRLPSSIVEDLSHALDRVATLERF